MREEISDEIMNKVMEECAVHILKILKKKGRGSFSSIHEARGVIEEEIWELQEAFHSKNWNRVEEMKDLITAGIFMMACMKSKTMEW
jgi:DNA-binding Lrp family transcriptional regulator